MANESRVKKTMLNAKINLICYFASLITAFFTRKILLDHPERYMYMDNDEYQELHDMGVKFQLKLPSLCGAYVNTVKKRALWLLKNGLYYAIGSNTHCEDAIEYITNCKLSKQAIEQVERLLHNSI